MGPPERSSWCGRRELAIAVCVALVFWFVAEDVLLEATSTREERSEASVALPLYLKFRKTGGTSVAATLARNVYSSDRAFARWRAALEGGSSRLGLARRPLAAACGNYDGHWATLTYRSFGAAGMRVCGGVLPSRPNALLVTLLRDPVSRFVSRLYYELGGRSDVLLAPPFSRPVASWGAADLVEMEAIMCEACGQINGGHCHWRGGACDTPQEYLVVLSRLGTIGLKTGELQTPPAATSVSVSLPSTRKARRRALEIAKRSLRRDFAVVGVLEELDVFFASLAAALRWPLDRFLYSSRKVHDSARQPACARRLAKDEDRAEERAEKRRNAARAKTTAGVEWSGVFPLLGWNNHSAPKTLGPEALSYARRRNADDVVLWTEARDVARRAAPPDLVEKFTLLQRAYRAGLVPNSLGFYAFCDWRPDVDNAPCRACADSFPTLPCDIAGDRVTLRAATCRTDLPPNHDFRLAFHPASFNASRPT